MPRVSISGTDQIYEVNDGEVLYDALYDRGVTLPHGCLSGSCGACKVEVLEGKENLQAPGVIEANTIEAVKEEYKVTHGDEFLAKEVRLSCRARVKGDVCIKPIK